MTTPTPTPILRAIKAGPSRTVVFIGHDHCAIHDGDIAHPVSRTVAHAAIQFGRLTIYATHSNGTTYAIFQDQDT